MNSNLERNPWSEAFAWFWYNDAEIFEYADILGGVTLEDVSKAFEQSFLPSTVTLSVVYPLNEN